MRGSGSGEPTAGRRRRALRTVPTPPGSAGSELDALLQRTAQGDHDAFAGVYDELSASVYGLVRRVLRDPAQSEEITQEVFLELWRTASRFDATRGSARTWVLTMAHRRAVDRVRSEQASRDRKDRVGARSIDRGADVVSETVEARFERQEVRDALALLTDLQRQALELAYYGGLTYSQVAERLGAPLPTVKTRLRDGLIRLRAALAPAGGGADV